MGFFQLSAYSLLTQNKRSVNINLTLNVTYMEYSNSNNNNIFTLRDQFTIFSYLHKPFFFFLNDLKTGVSFNPRCCNRPNYPLNAPQHVVSM